LGLGLVLELAWWKLVIGGELAGRGRDQVVTYWGGLGSLGGLNAYQILGRLNLQDIVRYC